MQAALKNTYAWRVEFIMNNVNLDLIYNVAQLMKEPVGSTRKLEVSTPVLQLSDGSEPGDDAQVLEARDVTGPVKITRLTRDLLVQGEVTGQVTLECSRCLVPVTVPVSAHLEEEYQPTIEVETGRPVHREEFEVDDSFFRISANHEVDLTEPVRQAMLVEMPLKPLCREDCKGLCPQCGANLNEGPCDCETDTEDNRWAALRELKLEDLPAGDSNLN